VVVAFPPGPVIDADDLQGVGAAGHHPGALFENAQDGVVTDRHTEATQEACAPATPERIADQVDDVAQTSRVARMSPAHIGEPFREHLGVASRVPTPPAADVEAERDGRPLRRQILQCPGVATMASTGPTTARGTARRVLACRFDQHSVVGSGNAKQPQRRRTRKKLNPAP
jgi:hypothetical protein